ncbi:MAG: M56 family metallopeptidase [Bryobacterales bacterium]|nr:M56 family metallopeptidase [Bryobacterales bacterium]
MTVDSLAEFWWRYILPAALQATPLLLLAAALDLLLPRAVAPVWRSALWTVAALKLALPSTQLAPWGLLPRWQLEATQPLQPLAAFAWIVPALWLTGGIILVAGSWLWLRRGVLHWTRHAVPTHNHRLQQLAASMGIRAPRLLESAALDGPVVTGLIRPTIFWPSAIQSYLTETEQQQVMRHELAHIVRRDAWREFAWLVLLAAFWFHPLVWWGARRMRSIREQSCDRTAARLPGHCPDSYRSALLKVMARIEGLAPLPGLALIDPRTPLADRLELLRTAPSGTWRTIAGCLALVALLAAWPALSWADRSSETVAEWMVRPPGSLQLQYHVLQRLAEEDSK